MSFGERFKKARIERGFSQDSIAQMLGVTDGTISNYEKGVAFPRWDTVKKICDILQVDPNYMFWDDLTDNLKSKIIDNITFSDKPDETLILSQYKKLDAYGKEVVNNVINIELKRVNDMKKQEEKQKVSADTEQEYAKIIYFDTPVSAGTGQYLDDSNYIMLDVLEEPPVGAEFIVRVCGDSMEPTYKDGDKLYVNPNLEVNVGDIGIFYVNGDVYVKERAKDGLISHNEKYPKIKFNEYDDIECYGQVLGVCKKYR